MSENELKISDNLSLPREAATWVLAYLAKRGAGKTYNAAVQAEEMVKAGIPIGVVDGMGIWWGLRASADGKGEGLPIVVFGGEHADLPLVPEKAAEVAKAIVESNISFVLDLSSFSKYVSRKIVIAFLDELYRLNRVDRHIFIEESDMFAPQKPIGPEENLCLSSVDNFVRRGGNHNLGCTLITQRSAVLNKNILTQSDCLVILRTLAPVDKKAIQAWVEQQTDEDEEKLKQWYDSLNNLENGEAWVWHPEKTVIYKKVKFRKRETFHATREFIRSPQATQVKLMNVSEFVSKFKTVFDLKAAPEATVQASLQKGLEEIGQLAELQLTKKKVEEDLEKERKANGEIKEYVKKLTEDFEKKLANLNQVMSGMQEQLGEQNQELKDFEALKEVFGRVFGVDRFMAQLELKVEEFKHLPASLPISNIPEGDGAAAVNSVGLQATTTIVDLPPVEMLAVIDQSTDKGKILVVARKGKLSDWQKLGQIMKALEEEHWSLSPQQTNNALTDLVKLGLISKKHTDCNYFCLAPGVKFKEAA